MNKKKAESIARGWLNQKPKPKELSFSLVREVLAGLNFKEVGGHSGHSAYRLRHPCLRLDSDYFQFEIIKIAAGSKTGAKKVIRIDGVKRVLRALQLYFEDQDA